MVFFHRIFFDKTNGNILVNVIENENSVNYGIAITKKNYLNYIMSNEMLIKIDSVKKEI